MGARADRTDISADQTVWTADGSMPSAPEADLAGGGVMLRDPEIQPEPARLALVRALEVFADAPAERAQIVAAAIELQIKP